MSPTAQPVVARLTKALGAAALGPIATAVIQLGSVPLLLHAWGAAKYGDWLLLSAVPSYLALSGLGFGDSSGSDMTMRVAGGDREGALRTFQSSWVLLSSISLAVISVTLAIVWSVPWQQMLHLAGMTSRQAASIVLMLAVYILTVQQWSIVESGYRCDGNFALGFFCSSIQRLLEALAATVVGVATGSLFLVSLSYATVRLLGLVGYRLLLMRISPWLTLGFAHSSMRTIRGLLKPSFGFIAMPLGTAVSVQGFMTVIGMVLGPIAVTVFSTARTLTRVGVLVNNSIAGGIQPEFSSAFGAGNFLLARKLHRYAYQTILMVATACAALLWVFGPTIYQTWVRKSVALDVSCFHVLLLVAIANSLWFVSGIAQMSANRHAGMAFSYLGAALVSCIMCYWLARTLGLAGAAMALLLIDGIMCGFVLPKSLKQMQDTPREFFRAVFGSAPYFVRPILATCGLRR